MTTTDSLNPNIARSTTDPIGGIYTATVPGQKKAEGELGKDAFLKLLVAQMKYQDPMNPADGTEFVAQTAQFTMVEKLVAMEEQNNKLLQSQQALTASTFIGRDVHWITKDAAGLDENHTGTVSGVSFTKDGPTLRVGTEDIPLSAIQSVAPIIETEPPEGEGSTTDDTTGTDAADQTPND